jgi:hypothetical protein
MFVVFCKVSGEWRGGVGGAPPLGSAPDIRTLSVNIKFICTSFRNRQSSETLASFSGLFRSEYK